MTKEPYAIKGKTPHGVKHKEAQPPAEIFYRGVQQDCCGTTPQFRFARPPQLTSPTLSAAALQFLPSSCGTDGPGRRAHQGRKARGRRRGREASPPRSQGASQTPVLHVWVPSSNHLPGKKTKKISFRFLFWRKRKCPSRSGDAVQAWDNPRSRTSLCKRPPKGGEDTGRINQCEARRRPETDAAACLSVLLIWSAVVCIRLRSA